MLPVAVGSSIAAIVLGLMYWALRIGFADPLMPIASSIGLALLFINIPVLVSAALERGDDRRQWFRSYSFVWLVTFASIAGIGRLSVSSEWNPAAGVAVLGLIVFLLTIARWIRCTSLRRGTVLILGSGLFATWAGGVVWGRIYKSPLFTEMLIANGIVHHDAVTLAALGNMLRTYHVASMGLDGLPYMAYHWGTPWLFAQLSNLTSQSVLEFYQLGYAITMIPLFFGGVLAFAVQLRRGEQGSRLIFWSVFIAATIGFLPVAGLDALGVWTSNLVISESYAVAIPVALMLTATLVEFWRERGERVLSENATVLDLAFLALFLAGGIVALGYLKISFMVLAFAAVAYAAMRTEAWRRWPLALIGVWTTVWVAVTYMRVSLAAHREGIALFDFLEGFVPRVWWPFFILAQLFWSIVFVALRLRQENARTVGDAIALFKTRKILDVEIVAVVAILGTIPGFVLHIDGGSAFYFSDIQRWLSVGLILASVSTLFPRMERPKFTRLAAIGISFVALPFIISTARNSVFWTTRMLRANVELRRSLYPPAEAGRIPWRIRSLSFLTDPAKLDDGLRRSANYTPVHSLIQLSRLPLTEKRRSALFIPQTDERYWGILKRPGACAFSGFVAPALTGISMIDGMPRADCKLSPYYGLSLFQRRTGPQRPDEIAPSELCARATRLGFERVIELRFDAEGRMSSEPMECAKPG